jgi:dipeptidyl aminopeptidase/acylaminoacyl peptidase
VDFKGQELHNPVWMADGRSLLVVEGDSSSNGGVTRIPLDAPARAQRLGGLEHVKRLALSRDGTKLVFSRGGDDSEIWRFDLRDPSKSGRLASSTLWDGDAQYSPDGRRIAFASNRNGGRELWVSDADGGNAQPVTHFDGPVPGTPRWSPDGRQIAFDGRPGGNSDIFVVSADGGLIRQLTKTPGADARPAWSADGQAIYFSSDRSGRPEIWRMGLDGQNPAQVTRDGGAAVLASPERPYVFYKRFGSNTPVYRIREDGTGDEPFSEPTFAFLPFAVTTSGLWYVGLPTPARARFAVRVMRLSDRKAADVAHFDWPPGGLAISVSPDERYVLVTRQDTSGTDLRLVNGFR